MNQTPFHYGIVVSNAIDTKAFIHRILTEKCTGDLSVFNNFKGVLFSDLAIAQFIEKEHRYQSIEISKSENRQLLSFSSGERRKLFLEHCLVQQPDYIIFDNLFDHLDEQSRFELSKQLKEIAHSISILQLAACEENLLPFIKNRGYVSDNSFVISKIKVMPQDQKDKPTSDFPCSLAAVGENYNTLIKFNRVSVRYESKSIVKNISWEVRQGEFWQLVGPNGSGKSTLLSLITGDNVKAYGQNIIIFNRKKGSGESIWDLKKKIGYFSTNLAELFKRNQTVEQMVLSGFFDAIGLYVKPSGLQQQKAVQWLDVIEMGYLRHSYFNRLSLGQQRLVLIVRSLIKQPPLLILDEPFEGLDRVNMTLVAELINTLVEKTEITIIYVSHTIEKSLAPSHIYELTPTPDGSIGQVKE